MQNYFNQFRQTWYQVIPVSNDMEVNSVAEDYSGRPIYFHNRANNEIIVRQFDISSGLTTTQKFIKSDGTEKPTSDLKPEFDISLYDEKLNAITSRINGLEEKLEKGGKK